MNEAITINPENESTKVSIELAVADDAEAIAHIQRKTWIDTYPNKDYDITEQDIIDKFDDSGSQSMAGRVERFRRSIESRDENHEFFVAKLDGRVIGFIMPNLNNGQHRLGGLYVLPEAQGMGAGRKLVSEVMDWYGGDKDIYLHVAKYNQKAIKFYESFGFIKTGKQFNPFREGLKWKTIPEYEMVLAGKK